MEKFFVASISLGNTQYLEVINKFHYWINEKEYATHFTYKQAEKKVISLNKEAVRYGSGTVYFMLACNSSYPTIK